jgi:BON domain
MVIALRCKDFGVFFPGHVGPVGMLPSDLDAFCRYCCAFTVPFEPVSKQFTASANHDLRPKVMNVQPASGATKHATACDASCASTGTTILENAAHRLRHSSYPQLRKITCEFHEGVLTLRGIVSSFFIKQLAHRTVADVSGIDMVANHLDVRSALLTSNNQIESI